MVEKKLVPKLRFNGFEDDEWHEVKIEDKFDKVRNGFVGVATPYYVEKGIPYLQSNNIRRNKIDKTQMVYINKEFHEKHEKSMLKENDILVVQSGHAGECTVVPKEFEGCNCHALIIMSPNDVTSINSTFCAYYLNSPVGIKKLFPLITGNTIKHILASEMKKLIINLPSLNEQNKLSHFLSIIDKKIDLLENKLQAYVDFKKYLMQQIFAQKLRFDFENDWEEFTLGDIGETYNGLSGLSKDNFEKGNSRYITYKSIFDNNVLIEDLTESVELNNKSQNNVEKGDLFFTGSSETPEEVGMVSVLNFDIDNCYLNSFCFGYRLKNLTKVNPIFLAYYLRSPIMRNKIQILAQGSTRFNLSKKEILKLKINIPDIKEQIKILDLMQNNDKLLKNTSCQITEMNLFKKSLLQQMFV